MSSEISNKEKLSLCEKGFLRIDFLVVMEPLCPVPKLASEFQEFLIFSSKLVFL